MPLSYPFRSLTGLFLLFIGLFVPAANLYGIDSYLFAGSIVLCGWHMLRAACLSLLSLRVSAGLFIFLAAVGLISINKLPEAAKYVCLIATLELIQNYTAARQLRQLYDSWQNPPAPVKIFDGEGFSAALSSEIKCGDVILLEEKQVLPVDAIVRSGKAKILPPTIAPPASTHCAGEGSFVFAGLSAAEGRLTAEAVSAQETSLFSSILNTLKQAAVEKELRTLKYYHQHYSRRLLTFIFFMAVPYYFFAISMLNWLYYTLAILLIFAPYNPLVKASALFLSFVMDKADKSGVIVKNPVAFEKISEVKAVAFEKATTLANGKLILSNLHAPYPFSRPELMRLAGALTKAAAHPLADTIASQGDGRAAEGELKAQIEEMDQFNIAGVIENRAVILGSNRFLLEKGIKTYVLLRKYAEYLNHGSTVLFMAVDGEAAGLLSFIDDIHPGIFTTIQKIRALDVKNIIMLTKEQEKAAASASKPLGFTDAVSNLHSAAKAAAVKKLHHNYGSVLIVGNAETDADSFASADISIAVNAAKDLGAALDSADIIMLGDHLACLPAVFAMGKACQKFTKIYRRLFLGVKFILFATVIFNVFYIWQAILLDGLFGIVLLLNCRRLAHKK
ncbi:MAG: HAD-IC family P-type ATPase [Acidaminococcales bacterium]|jgi:Cd2+/Zn2+-exporting ATPase|nr:HAD-IC family P-type ATPase [Acidaminococcales bacterium]MDR3348083.1 HAD-IC family P-type ATPase [Acidaminococcales bacterium]